MSSSALLEEIRIEIRSILISSPTGLTDEELARDYALFNSQRSLPYQTFGYATRKEFLDSLKDILYRSSDGCLHPIVNQSTEHIFKFVQQQRKKKRKPVKQIPIPSRRQWPPPDGATKKVEYSIKPYGSVLPSKPTFERIPLTNEFLQRLLIHFRQVSPRQTVQL